MNSKNNSNKTSVDNVWQYAQLRIKVYATQLAACTDEELRAHPIYLGETF